MAIPTVVSAQPTRLGALDSGNGTEPVLGVPPPGDLALGYAEILASPAYWANVASELTGRGAYSLPVPVDPLKPELILPVERVEPVADPSFVYPLPYADPGVDLSQVTYEWNGSEKTLADYMKSTHTDATVWVSDGEIVAEYYEGGWSPELRHQPWSVAKSFVSALVGIAIEESRKPDSFLYARLGGTPILLDDPIEQYVPDLEGTSWKGATIRNLLEMESGVSWDEDTPIVVFNTAIEQFVALWLDHVTDGAAGQGRNEFLKALPRLSCSPGERSAPHLGDQSPVCGPEGEWGPGQKFSYNSGNTQVLGWMLELLYARGAEPFRPFSWILSEKLWKPMGMAGDAAVIVDREGWSLSSQGIYSRSHDLARFGELYRNRGRTPAGTQVVPEEWVVRSTTHTALSNGEYAAQWWYGVTPTGYAASGLEGNEIDVEPDCGTTAVRLSHQLGGAMRPDGGSPFDPEAYSFEVDMGYEEWARLHLAVLRELGLLDDDGTSCRNVP